MIEKLKESGSIPPSDINGLTPSDNIPQETKTKAKKVKSKKPKPKLKILLIVGDDLSNYDKRGLYEAITVNGKPYFLRCYSAGRNPNCGKLFSIEPTVNIIEELKNEYAKKVIYKPKIISIDALPFEPVGKDQQNVIEQNARYYIPTTQELFDRIISQIQLYADIPVDWSKVCALLILMSYEQHKFNWVPYLGIFGDTGSGKSVLAEIMSKLGYRCGYFTDENSADIFQYLSEFEGTVPCLVEDEIQGVEKETEKIKIYKSGNSSSGKTSRIDTSSGRKLVVYPTYGFKVLAGEQIPAVKGLNERTLILNMSKGKASKSWYDRTEEDILDLKKLKWDLLKWRMANYFERYPNDIKATSRIENNLKPLRVIAKGLSFEQELESWCKKAVQASEKEKKATLEYCVVEAVYNLVSKGDFEFGTVFQGQEEIKIYINFEKLWRSSRNTMPLQLLQSDKVQTTTLVNLQKIRLGEL
jgi:hypothetical protein